MLLEMEFTLVCCMSFLFATAHGSVAMAWVQIAATTLSGNSLRQTVHEIGSSPLKGCEGNCGPCGK